MGGRDRQIRFDAVGNGFVLIQQTRIIDHTFQAFGCSRKVLADLPRGVRRNVEKKISAAFQSGLVGLIQFIHRFGAFTRAPEPMRRHAPAHFQRDVPGLAVNPFVRIISGRLRHGFLAVGHVRGPGTGVDLARIHKAGVHHHHHVLVVVLDGVVQIGALFESERPGDVQPKIVKGIFPHQFQQLQLDEFEIVVIGCIIGIVIQIQKAVIQTGGKVVFLAGIDKKLHQVVFVRRIGDVKIRVLAIPQTMSGGVLGGKHGVIHSQIFCDPNPLIRIRITRIVFLSRFKIELVAPPTADIVIQAKMDKHAKARLGKPFCVLFSAGVVNRQNRQTADKQDKGDFFHAFSSL